MAKIISEEKDISIRSACKIFGSVASIAKNRVIGYKELKS
jgi:hypothetical protein